MDDGGVKIILRAHLKQRCAAPGALQAASRARRAAPKHELPSRGVTLELVRLKQAAQGILHRASAPRSVRQDRREASPLLIQDEHLQGSARRRLTS